jgi:hypothetical protein
MKYGISCHWQGSRSIIMPPLAHPVESYTPSRQKAMTKHVNHTTRCFVFLLCKGEASGFNTRESHHLQRFGKGCGISRRTRYVQE